jgi:hypothetical protein
MDNTESETNDNHRKKTPHVPVLKYLPDLHLIVSIYAFILKAVLIRSTAAKS